MENIGQQILGEMWQNQQGDNDNFEVEDDEDDRDADGTLDGGVATNPEDGSGSNGKRRSTECDLVRDLRRFW